jgi:alginate O-acetyltransferase complex protein AlgI
VLGDFIAVYFTDIVFDSPGDYTSLENLLALYGFTLQIYADFSGYSDIAIGIAKLMGYEIPENFDRPYQALDVGEFWRRWHMTLSTWLRDYLFFPLGGSKGSNARTYFNLWLTMFLVGMWHGASWNFVIYSNLQGGAVLFNRWNRLRSRTAVWRMLLWGLVLPIFAAAVYGFGLAVLDLDLDKAATLAGIAAAVFALIVLLPSKGRWVTPLHVLLTFHFATLTRVFFRSDDLDKAKAMIGKLLEFEPRGFREGLFRVQGVHDWLREVGDVTRWWMRPIDLAAEYGLLILLVAGTLYHFTPREWVDERFRGWFGRLPGPVIGLVYAALCLLILHLLDGPRANIYFAF